MRNSIILAFLALISALPLSAQKVVTANGKCENELVWTFDGQTLTIKLESDKLTAAAIPDYDMERKLAPWKKRELPIKRVRIGEGIVRIGSCAFANCKELETVEFVNDRSFVEIGSLAFLNCSRLFRFTIPKSTKKIEMAAFANCSSLRAVNVPDKTIVEDQAFLSCTKLDVIEVGSTASLGKLVFATEVRQGDKLSHQFYNKTIRRLPPYITEGNCEVYGLAKDAVKGIVRAHFEEDDINRPTSIVDSVIPEGYNSRNLVYALIIGNQNYRFAADVPYAKHDARVFADYCRQTLRIPAENIHVCEDATKYMILEEEIGDWLEKIPFKDKRSLIVYYAGHGVPDTRDGNKAYILPTDVYGTKPQRGISLDDFYATLGDLAFNQVTVFMDACFSGINRNNDAVNEGLRAVEIEASEGRMSSGNLVVFSAAQGNETAQGYSQEGHGLFTYYLLKKLQDSRGVVTYGQLANYLLDRVSQKAPTIGKRKKQTPTATASENMPPEWMDMTF